MLKTFQKPNFSMPLANDAMVLLKNYLGVVWCHNRILEAIINHGVMSPPPVIFSDQSPFFF